LKDESKEVRRREALLDKDLEVRMYAEEALKMAEAKGMR